jgi:hypothetical protein
MKKIILSSVMALSLFGSSVGTIIHADEVDTNVVQKTTGSVGFKAPDNPFTVVNDASTIDFGTQDIASNGKTYTATAGINSTVTDLRGIKSGWTLNVAQNGQLAQGSDKLEGAVLTLGAPSITAGKATAGAAITLDPEGASSVVMSAADVNAGRGISTAKLEAATLTTTDDTIQLAGTDDANGYTTNLTWTLTDGVSNS